MPRLGRVDSLTTLARLVQLDYQTPHLVSDIRASTQCPSL